MTPDVIVVGAGAIGASIAYQLQKAGARVLVAERGKVGGRATPASAGLIMVRADPPEPAAVTELFSESAREFAPLSEELLERTGLDIGYRSAATLELAFNDIEEQALRHGRHVAERTAVAPAWLDPRSALDLEPALNPSIRGALLYAEDHQVEPLVFAQALMRAAVDLGAVVREGADVERLLVEGDRITGVWLDGQSVRADEVVLAGGAWMGRWSDALRIPIPVRPIRGQMVAIHTIGTALRHVLSGSQAFLVPKPHGSTYVGTTVEDVGFDARPTVEAVARLLAAVPQLAPALADATVQRVWAGLRPASGDGLPIIGRAPGWSGVSLATGHFRNGILLAPVTGILITDLLRNGRTRLPLGPFEPGRFLPHAA